MAVLCWFRALVVIQSYAGSIPVGHPMNESAVTVCIPTIPTRGEMLKRAVKSVYRQTLPAHLTLIEMDTTRSGEAATRQRAVDKVETPLVAFLDDDDEFLPNHLELLVAEINRSGADLVYPWFQSTGRQFPLGRTPRPFDADELRRGNFIPVTVLARTESLRAAGGFTEPKTVDKPYPDWDLWVRMLNNGAKFSSIPDATWIWHFGEHQTGGIPGVQAGKDRVQ